MKKKHFLDEFENISLVKNKNLCISINHFLSSSKGKEKCKLYCKYVNKTKIFFLLQTNSYFSFLNNVFLKLFIFTKLFDIVND